APPGYLPSCLLMPAGDPGTMNLSLVNCILANLGAFCPARPAAVTASHTGFYNNGEAAFGSAPVSTLSPPFETQGAGWYYLAPGSGFQNAGTLEVDNALLQTLRRGTTARPPAWSNLTVASALTLAPAVARDTDAPDLGYHYPPLDLLVTGPVTVTNASLALTNGVVVGGGDGTWFLLRAGVPVSSIGSATAPDRFTDYRTVQEQPVKLGPLPNSTGFALNAHRAGGAAAPATLRFTRFTRLAAAGSGYDLYAGSEWRYSALAVRDCGFAGGQVCLNQDAVPVTLANNLFVNTIGWVGGQQALDFFNNTVHGPWWEFECYTRPGWDIRDNLFVDCGVGEFGDEPVNHHHNGYVNCSTSYYTALGSTDQVLGSLAFATGPLGDYYLPEGSGLIDGGSVPDAGAAGFYYYTTQASQAPEANSAVDIGFHSMALDAAGQCLDADEDRLPDWWEWRHFGSLDARGEEDYDSDGRWNLDEYLSGSDPNTISNLLHVESFWVNTSSVAGTVEVLAGVPGQMAVLVNNTNFDQAVWTPYSAQFAATLGATDGVYKVWVGLRGRAEDSEATWNRVRFIRDTQPPVLVLTNPAAATGSVALVQLQGYCEEPLESLRFDLANAAGVLTNEQGFVKEQFYDPHLHAFTTNYFQCYDLELTNGQNEVTLRATDLAGNVWETNLTLTL
ncbi:MAG TPA: hypothetical protein PKX23_19730, partial [Verrucomicrobiota bacterium]|nr:hypothetical protein [Verrucomicrobiota bacterium]